MKGRANDQRILLRQERLLQAMVQKRLNFLVAAKPANIFYLTGFRGSAGVVAIGEGEGTLWVDPRYDLQAREEAVGLRVVVKRSHLLDAAAEHLARHGRGARAGYDESSLTCEGFARLKALTKGKVRWTEAAGMVEALRETKDEEEIASIRAASALTVEALSQTLPLVRPGVSELGLAAEIEYRMKRGGADGPAFETIVASGPRSAWPHARPSSKPLQAGELVIFDLGAILGGYAADMTRTVFLGSPSRRIRQLYAAAEEAQAEGVAAARAGERAGAVDAAARGSLKRRGLDKFFTHSTGHGVGIEIHEQPRLAKGVAARLPYHSVVTVEPGVYIEGLGGVRIEDTVLVSEGFPEILTPAGKDEWIID